MDLIDIAIAKKFVRDLAGAGHTDETVKDNTDAISTKESIANVNTLKGTGWAGETVKGNAEDIEAHKEASMPHIFHNLKTGKTYKYGFQLSAEGNPQTIYEEIVE